MSSRTNRRFPAVLLVAGTAALACVLARELTALPVPVPGPGESRTFGVDGLALVRATMVAGYLLWLVLEARITFADGRSPGAGGRDGSDATVYVYGLARVLTVGAAVCAGSYWTGVTPAVLAGGAVFACGVTLRLAAVRRLGRLYSHRVRLVADHPIVRSGCYRFVRHPAYLGMIVAHGGFVLVFLNPYSVLALLLLIGSVVALRIPLEERTLMGSVEYAEYARTRDRLLPGLW